MGLLDMCCPKKPKMTLDYVIKWVEETDKTLKEVVDWVQEIKEMDLQKVFDDYARDEYDWSQVPEFDAKADKVENSIEGNFASLDSEGNLQDSGKKASDFLTAESATSGNFASFNEAGNLKDSNTKPSDFAPAVHTHDRITDFSGTQECGASISVGEGDPGAGLISLLVKGDGVSTESKIAEIDYSSIDNLNRALEDPESNAPSDSSDKLITSGAVYTAISKKSDEEFCDKVYSRLIELEKKSSVEYSITAIYDYGVNKPFLRINGNNIIYDYDRTSEKIMVLYDVPYLFGLTFVGDVLVIKDLTTGTSLGIATVENLITSPNRIVLSGLPLPADASYINKNIEIAITHGNY